MFALCKYFRNLNLIVIKVTCIKAVIAMIPHTPLGMEEADKYFYLVERLGLDCANLGDMQQIFDKDTEQT